MNEKMKDNVRSGLMIVGIMLSMIGGIELPSLIGNKITKSIHKYEPTNAHLEYVNQDSLPDLVYKTGEIYLQTKDGKFVSYKEALAKEKAKIDLTDQFKADSLKKVFENKLEKGFR